MTSREPVFILSPARSYSSVVTMIIGAHPQLLGMPELALLGFGSVGEAMDHKVEAMRAKGYEAVTAPGLTQAVAQLIFGGQGDEQVWSAREWLASRRSWSPRTMFDVLGEHASPRVMIEQSPETVMSPTGLEMLDDDFPDSPIIHLVRHPITSAESMVRYWKDWLSFAGDDGRWQRALLLWLSQHRRISEFLPSRMMARTVRAEDALSSSETLRGICAFLGIENSEEAIRAMRRADSNFVGNLHPHVRGALDPGFVSDPRPRVAPELQPVRFPREWNIDPFLQMQVLAMAGQLGYQVD